MSDKKGSRPKSTRGRKQQQKVRVKLPGIESYEKELEFTAEGPGRVVVRLERLMGSDRIRITDPKYLSTLVERLESEEASAWVSRSRLRKKAEKNRSRQLAIEGLMEPASDMQDLWNHPVFRVNRVLNRLAVFDQNMSHAAGTISKAPPIQPTEPFEGEGEDVSTGGVFKTYPGHRVFVKDELPFTQLAPSKARMSVRPSVASGGNGSKRSKSSGRMSMASSQKAAPKPKKVKPARKEDDEDEEEEEEEGDEEEEEGTTRKPQRDVTEEDDEDGEEGEEDEGGEEETEVPPGNSLQRLQREYGIDQNSDLARDWQAFRSHLVEMVYEGGGGSLNELYQMADDVIGVYTRQQDTTEDFLSNRKTQVQEEEKALSKVKSSASTSSQLGQGQSKTKTDQAEEEEDEEEDDKE